MAAASAAAAPLAASAVEPSGLVPDAQGKIPATPEITRALQKRGDLRRAKVPSGIVPSSAQGYAPLPDGGELYYRLFGPDTARHKVLYVMGYASDMSLWQPQVEYMCLRPDADDFQVCIFDNRGTGGSSDPPGTFASRRWTTADFSDDAMALVNHLGWPLFHLIGASMGGMIAQRMALRHGHRMLSLALLVTHAGGRNSVVLKGARLLSEAATPGIAVEKRSELLMRALFGTDVFDDPKTFEEQKRFMVERQTGVPECTPRTMKAHQEAVFRHYLRWEDLLRVRAMGIPTIVLIGEQDVLVSPEGGREVAKGLGVEPLEVKGGGHSLHPRAFDLVGPALADNILKAEREVVVADDETRGRNDLMRKPTSSLPVAVELADGPVDDAAVPWIERLESRRDVRLDKALRHACCHALPCGLHVVVSGVQTGAAAATAAAIVRVALAVPAARAVLGSVLSASAMATLRRSPSAAMWVFAVAVLCGGLKTTTYSLACVARSMRAYMAAKKLGINVPVGFSLPWVTVVTSVLGALLSAWAAGKLVGK